MKSRSYAKFYETRVMSLLFYSIRMASNNSCYGSKPMLVMRGFESSAHLSPLPCGNTTSADSEMSGGKPTRKGEAVFTRLN